MSRMSKDQALGSAAKLIEESSKLKEAGHADLAMQVAAKAAKLMRLVEKGKYK
jgi:hypothetical protein